MLMGGTLTVFIALGWYSVTGRGGYIGTLLGPERTGVSLSFQAKNGRGFLGVSYRRAFGSGWCRSGE